MSDSDSTTAWVTVAEAAEKAQVDTGTVRQWYRAGHVPTRRAEGPRGAFLVPLELVLQLANPPDALDVPAASSFEPSIEAALKGLTADRESEIESLRGDLAQAREQLEFLRAQLAEASSENRTLKQQLQAADDQRADLRAQLADAVDDRKGVEARLATVEAELTQLRRTAARSSITDNSWLDLQTPAYESPVRRQAMAPPPPGATAATPPADGPTAPYAEPPTGVLSERLADTRPDGDGDAAGETDERAPEPSSDDILAEDARQAEYTATHAIWTDEAPHPPLGESPDDLLPEPEKKGRFGKR